MLMAALWLQVYVESRRSVLERALQVGPALPRGLLARGEAVGELSAAAETIS